MTHRRPLQGATMLWAIGACSLYGYMDLPAAEAAIAHRAPGHLVLVLGALFILYLGACVLILRGAVKTRRALLAALALATLFRFILLPTPPVLSGDAYRYVWDARLLAHHLSPYLYAPADARVHFLRDRAIYPHTGWHGVPTLLGARPAGYLGRYVTDQDFNQWLYEPTHWVTSPVARHLLHTLPLVALLPVLGVITWQRRRGALDTMAAMVALLTAVLLFSPSMFPWYLLTVLPLLALVLELREERAALRVRWWPRAWLGPAPYLALVLLSGTVVWSYAFGLGLRLHWVGVVEYLPSYLLLVAGLRPALRGLYGGRWWRVAPQSAGDFLSTTLPRGARGGARDAGRCLAGGAERIRTSVFGLRRRSPG